MVKLLFIGPNDGGGISTINQQVINLAAKNNDFYINTLFTSKLRTWNKVFGYLLLYYLCFIKIIKNKPNIVYLQISKTGFFHQSLFLLVSKILNCKTCAHLHANPNFTESSNAFEKLKYNLSQLYIDRLIVLDNSCLFDMEEYGWKKPISVLPNFIKIHNIEQSKQDNSVLFIGRMEVEKGIFKILEVAKLLPDYKFTFIGPFSEKVLENEFNKSISGLSNIKWLGPIFGEEKHKYIAINEMLLLPTKKEVFPVVLLESWSYGTIPLISKVGLLQNIIKDGHNGFFINPNDSMEIAKKILMIKKNYELMQSIASNCFRTLSQNYVDDAVEYNFKIIINEIIQN